MMINGKKTKTMIFNFTENFKFTTRLRLKSENIEVINNTQFLGTIITDDLKWDLNSKSIVKKANMSMEPIRKVSSFDVPIEHRKDLYILFVRSILEQSATVCHNSISIENANDLERVKKNQQYK